jgi:predicted DNA-binding transcriptional regulator YafY
MSKRGKMTERQTDIPFLLNERPRTRRELAQHFGVSPKTIERSMTELMRVAPITVEREGREVVYRFMDFQKLHPPQFTPAELAVLLLAQESIAATGLTAISSPFARHARSLLAKVRGYLHPTLQKKLDALAGVFGSAASPAKDFAPYAEIIDRLTTAAVDGRRVRLRYYTINTDKVSERVVEPYAVYFDPDGATLKLIAYDHRRRGIVPFSIDHIRGMSETGELFERSVFDLREFLAENCFNGIHGEPMQVRLRTRGVTARIFAERTFHRSQRIVERTERTEESEETVIIEMRVARGRGLVRFILSWVPDIEVLHPAELRSEVAASLRRALELADEKE